MFVIQQNSFDCKLTRDYAERCQVLSEQVHQQYFYVCKSISMEVFVLEHLNKLQPFTIPMANFIIVYLMKGIRMPELLQHIFVLFFYLFLQKKMTYPFLTTMWDHTDGCTKQYLCATATYILPCIDS